MRADRHLTRMTREQLERTLTPRADAAEIALKGMRAIVAHKVLLSGPEGIRARMSVAMHESLHRSMATEIDAGGGESRVNDLMCKVFGDMLAGLVLCFTHDATPAKRTELLTLFINNMGHQAQSILDRADSLDPSEFSGVVAPRMKPPGTC